MFNFLKRLYFKLVRVTTPAPTPGGYGDESGGVPFIPNWGIIVPHTKAAQGADSYNKKITEYIYGSMMVQQIGRPFATRDEGGVFGAARSLASRGVSASVETHYNAYNGLASGCEILVLEGDKLSEHYARLFVEDFALKFKKKLRGDRGVVFVSKGDRGYANLIAAKDAGMKVAILSELFFGDNAEDFVDYGDQAMFWHNTLVPVGDFPV